jgi:hypothetical protein
MVKHVRRIKHTPAKKNSKARPKRKVWSNVQSGYPHIRPAKTTFTALENIAVAIELVLVDAAVAIEAANAARLRADRMQLNLTRLLTEIRKLQS